MSNEYDNMLVQELEKGIILLTINRPLQLNALDEPLLRNILHYLGEAPKQGVRAIIVTGAGHRSFIVGADIKEMDRMSSEELYAFSRLGQAVGEAFEHAPFLVVAAINGYALGGGLEIALACDMCFAADTAQLGLPETNLGLVPGFGGTLRLTKAVGPRKAKELIMEGRVIDAREAHTLGIVNGVVDPEQLLDYCLKLCRRILKQPAEAVFEAKKAILRSLSEDSHSALQDESKAIARCFNNDDCKEAIHNFIYKKPGAAKHERKNRP